jgi:hypothetical protein
MAILAMLEHGQDARDTKFVRAAQVWLNNAGSLCEPKSKMILSMTQLPMTRWLDVPITRLSNGPTAR